MKIGQDTQFSNLDVVKAQTAAMQGLPAGFNAELRAEIGAGIIENVKNYALVMEADMSEAAEAIRSYLQTTNKDISTKEKALSEANKATNQLVKMAKLGGMNDEDVQGFMKFAAASGTAAGLSSETIMTLAALARRGGLRGDEAGTFVRATAAKLVSPTKQGRLALRAAGIDFNDYVGMPKKLDAGRLESQFQSELGKNFMLEGSRAAGQDARRSEGARKPRSVHRSRHGRRERAVREEKGSDGSCRPQAHCESVWRFLRGLGRDCRHGAPARRRNVEGYVARPVEQVADR